VIPTRKISCQAWRAVNAGIAFDPVTMMMSIGLASAYATATSAPSANRRAARASSPRRSVASRSPATNT
jgi:hypothetical protein